MSLARKKNIDNAEWIETFRNIESIVTEKEVAELEEAAVRAITQKTKGKTVAYAWSGGKDSIALNRLCEKAGIGPCVFAHTDLEYPAFLDWCLKNKPDACEVINVGLDLKWLADNPVMLFPHDRRIIYRWFQIVQQKAIRQYFRANNLDMIVVGHRTADGNFVGKDKICRNNAGVVRYSPIADWTHEQLLAYIHYRNLPMPPIYGWKDGFKCGTHPWPARQFTDSIKNGFRDVYEIDPEIVKQAAEFIPAARHFLEEVTT